MRKTCAFIFALLIIANATKLENLCARSDQLVKDCEPTAKPVCGVSISSNGQVRTDFINKCTACKAVETEFVVEGPCNSYPKTGSFCHPKQNTFKYCPQVIIPTCAVFEDQSNCKNPPCGYDDAINTCYACMSSDIALAFTGKCHQD
ncbi:kazal-type proteinase inhibitor 1 (macronuclear) [Tetrahymena thermophila SB210]|uniref:Kazal-type proteinase inhibitor 1 n=1 Tax=Tetrahymena thermophila (strain SB210) TaxID=312017 RepID=Q23QQ2_TETTS|nr:kazal-type proteinase inhibitor 1 [Tetrahymena thermophila SB210]EAR98836.1 kazal-type proteinase inhibitor 1 [Tetrahymena thermophila SB210]|eukprot:XP_001019081.1 kazal-type proteinase inhibitor 1 [Tetrahymena thermophila SB210]